MSWTKLTSALRRAFDSGKTAASNVAANVKTRSIFKKADSAARKTFTAANFKNDTLVRGAVGIGSFASRISKSRVGRFTGASIKFGARAINGTRKLAAKTGPIGLLTVGATAMLSVGIMKGMNNAAKDYVLERYMADQRFSRDILLQSRVGLSMGTNKMNRMGSTAGLSNALSKTRHGARY